MTKSDKAIKFLSQQKTVPVITLADLDQALPLAEKCLKYEFKLIEITLRTSAGLPAIQQIKAHYPELLVAAGTITSTEQMLEAKAMDADLQISPGSLASLYDLASKEDITYIPGIKTSSEIMAGIEYGYSLFKFFPADGLNGISPIKAFKDIFPQVVFMPTGDITEDIAENYLSISNVIAVGGSWMTKSLLNH